MSIEDQPPPVPSDRPAVWDLVIADMRERDAVGRQRYGTPLQPHNGRDALVDAYQEALDLVVYLRQAIEERGHVTGVVEDVHCHPAPGGVIVDLADPGCATCGRPRSEHEVTR
jgi:hypothetical protein